MNSVASVVKAVLGRATPKVRPPAVWLVGTVHVSNVMPVAGSVYTTGVLDWAQHGATVSQLANSPVVQVSNIMTDRC